MQQDKRPRNENFQKHGRWELYHNKKLKKVANYVNGVEYGHYYYKYFNTEIALIIYFAR